MEVGRLPASGRRDLVGSIFSRVLRRIAEETVWIQNQQHSDEGSNLTSQLDVESILQTLATCTRDSEAFSAFESGSDNGERERPLELY